MQQRARQKPHGACFVRGARRSQGERAAAEYMLGGEVNRKAATGPITAFDLFGCTSELVVMSVGAGAGAQWFGWGGAVVGLAVGFAVGAVLGQVPLIVAKQWMFRELRRDDVATLRARLETQYFIGHFIIAELLCRGEPIESFGEYVAGLARSESSDKRRIADQIIRIWPETAPPSPTEGGPDDDAPPDAKVE